VVDEAAEQREPLEDWFAAGPGESPAALWHPTMPPETHELLRDGEITGIELIPWGSNYTFCATIRAGERECLGVYKPRRGERPLWDFPSGTLYRREYAAYLVSQAIGWPFIPLTIIRDGPHGIGSMQHFVEAEPPRSIREIQDAADLSLARIAAFDFITNNADRKAGHILRDRDGKLWGIDQGLCFNVDPKVRTVLIHYCGQPVPAPVLRELETFRTDARRLDGLLHVLRHGLDADEVDVFVRRVDHILQRGTFPTISGRRGVPWPPF
jgi:uncharacterized repeat protein (TIGR03843 family)